MLPKSTARIHAPLPSAMQSGPGRGGWQLEFSSQNGPAIDPLTGWASSTNTSRQVRLAFETLDDAIAFANARGLAFEVMAQPPRRPMQPKVYADNFRSSRLENWSH